MRALIARLTRQAGCSTSQLSTPTVLLTAWCKASDPASASRASRLHLWRGQLSASMLLMQADLNVSLTAISMLWNASDLVAKLYSKGGETAKTAAAAAASASTPTAAATAAALKAEGDSPSNGMSTPTAAAAGAAGNGGSAAGAGAGAQGPALDSSKYEELVRLLSGALQVSQDIRPGSAQDLTSALREECCVQIVGLGSG